MLGRAAEEESGSEDEDSSKEKDAKLANNGYKDSFGRCGVHVKYWPELFIQLFFSRVHPSALVGVPEVQHVYLQLADSFIQAD